MKVKKMNNVPMTEKHEATRSMVAKVFFSSGVILTALSVVCRSECGTER